MKRLLYICLVSASALLLAGCFQTQTLGTVAGATVTVTALQQSEPELLTLHSTDANQYISWKGEERWLQFPAPLKLALVGVFRLPDGLVEPGRDYLVTAQGGINQDPGMTGSYQARGRPVHGQWHMVLPGNYPGNFKNKLSLLTEAAFQWLRYRSTEGYGSTDNVSELLDEAAQRLVTDLSGNGLVNYEDILLWDAYEHRGQYLGDPLALEQLDLAITLGFPQSEIQRLVLTMLGEYQAPPAPDFMEYLQRRLQAIFE